MAYNSIYPATYQQAYPQFPIYQPQQPQQPAPAQPQGGSGLTWVSGEAGAKSYLVAPNCTVPLWDSESQTVFLKSADASGMPTIKTLRYTIEEAAPQTPPMIQQNTQEQPYAAQADVDALKQEIKSIRKDIRKYMIMEVDDADE